GAGRAAFRYFDREIAGPRRRTDIGDNGARTGVVRAERSYLGVPASHKRRVIGIPQGSSQTGRQGGLGPPVSKGIGHFPQLPGRQQNEVGRRVQAEKGSTAGPFMVASG